LRASTSTSASAGGGLDLHQLGLVEGLVLYLAMLPYLRY